MREEVMSRNEAIDMVLGGLQVLISLGARGTARHEHNPSVDADSTDDAIAEGRKQVTILRKMRQDFEDLVFLGESAPP